MELLAFEFLMMWELRLYWSQNYTPIRVLHILSEVDYFDESVASVNHPFLYRAQVDDLKLSTLAYRSIIELILKVPDRDLVNCLCTYSSKSSSSFLLITLFKMIKNIPSPTANKPVRTSSFHQESLAKSKQEN